MVLSRRAQTILEYVVLISIITAAVVFMLPRVKRTTQSMFKLAADQIGDQKGAEQNFNDVRRGYLLGQSTRVAASANDLRTDINGVIDQTYDQSTETTTSSLMNSGWSEE